MKRFRNQQSISLILLLPVLIPLLFIVINDLDKWQIKFRSRERLKESSSLVQLRIPETKVQWMDEREIAVEGRMFDIKKATLENGWYTFTGHFDDKETKLLKKQQNAHQQNSGQQTLVHLFKSLQQLYHDPQEPVLPFPGPVSSLSSYRNDSLLTAFLDVSTPPPQVNSYYTV